MELDFIILGMFFCVCSCISFILYTKAEEEKQIREFQQEKWMEARRNSNRPEGK